MINPQNGLLHAQNVDRHHASPALGRPDPRRRNLTPSAGRRAEIDDAASGSKQMMSIIDFRKLEGGARTQTFRLRPRHIGVVELALEPALG